MKEIYLASIQICVLLKDSLLKFDINIEDPTSLINSSTNIDYLSEKCDEYNGEIQKIQFRMLQLESRLKQVSENTEILIIFVKGAILQKQSRSRYTVTIAQPYKAARAEDENGYEDSDINPTVIIDSTQYPPVFKSTPKNTSKKKFSFPSLKESFSHNPGNKQPKAQGYEEKFSSANKPNLENIGGTIGVKI